MSRLSHHILVIFWILVLFVVPESGKAGLKISIMTFNVENLFDTVDDPLKNDSTYLPKKLKENSKHKKSCMKVGVKHWRTQCLEWNWDQKALKIKMSRLAKVIRSVNNGQGPDILVLQEVENRRVLEMLRTQYLSDLNYHPSHLIEGKDFRGIDVAFLSKLKIKGKTVLHPVKFSEKDNKRTRDTRGILQANFVLPDGNILSGFAVHFPAPFHPTSMREDAFRELNNIVSQLPKEQMFFAAGDFNTTAEEDKTKGVLKRYLTKNWVVAHQVGCKNCRGTHYYPPKDSWSFLDMIILKKQLKKKSSPWQLNIDSIQVVNKVKEHRTVDNKPSEFKLPELSGVSDHWPIYLEIVKNK